MRTSDLLSVLVGACVLCTAGCDARVGGTASPPADGDKTDVDGDAGGEQAANTCAASAATRPCGVDRGVCHSGIETCAGGEWGACTGATLPTDEVCDDGLDNDCDGAADEQCPCSSGATQPCGSDTGACVRGQQTCSGDTWGACEGEIEPAVEVCDGEDNNCDGNVDEHCDDDHDGHCNSSLTVVGSPAICPLSPANTADDCSDGNPNVWAACTTCKDGDSDTYFAGCDAYTTVSGPDCDDGDGASHPGAVQVCDGKDNTCSGAVPDDELDHDGDHRVECAGWVGSVSASIVGGSDCADDDADVWVSCGSCLDTDGDGAYAGCDAYVTRVGPDCDPGDDERYPGATEICDGKDNACAGSVAANEVDSDGDKYVACEPWVGSSAAILGGGDCSEGNASVHPGTAEVCGDAIDNNCDGQTDLEDAVTCPMITVSIWHSVQPTPVGHGDAYNLGTNIAPNDPKSLAPFAWSRVWTVTDATPAPSSGATCSLGDVVLGSASDGSNYSMITATMPSALAQKGCIYTIQVVVNGYAKDSVTLQVVNDAPSITAVQNATFDGTAWRLHVAAGTPLGLTVTATDPDSDTPLTFDWSGANVGLLGCAAPCQSSDSTGLLQATVNWAASTTGGTYNLVVRVWDSYEPLVKTSANIVVEVDPCVWVVQGGSGTGSLASPLGSLAAALTQAQGAGVGTNVCVIGAGTFNENLTLPVSPTPDLLGGFSPTGNIHANRPIIVSSAVTGLQFAADHAGLLHHFIIRQSSADAAVITVQDASPEILDCQVQLGAGSNVTGIVVHAAASSPASTSPTIRGGTVEYNSITAISDATAVSVTAGAGALVSPKIIDTESISLNSCNGTCRAIALGAAAQAEITGNQLISAYSTNGIGIGLDLAGLPGDPASAVVNDNQWISGGGSSRGIGISLSNTDSVAITDNGDISANPGAQLGAGIADGWVERDGTLHAGDSSALVISGNHSVRGGFGWANRCVNPGDTGEGPDVVAGVLLVGTQDVSISDNGYPLDSFSGLAGGTTTLHWTASSRRLPPSVVGLWLIGTDAVSVEHNEIRGGLLNAVIGCPAPSVVPALIAYRDGLPPNAALLPAPAAGASPSQDTLFLRNGASCALPAENGSAGGGIVTWCTVVELNVPVVGTAPLLANNVLAATKGNYLVALRQRGGGGVLAVNNTLDADLILAPTDPPPLPGSIRKWPVWAEAIDSSGLALQNNIIYTHRDDPYDWVSERLVLRETVASGTSSRLALLKNNLMFIEGDDLADASAPTYVRVSDAGSSAEYAPTALNAIVGVGSSGANFAAQPGLIEYTEPWQKSLMRLTSGSAAVNAGSGGASVPSEDIDGDARPDATSGVVDIGHDELTP